MQEFKFDYANKCYIHNPAPVLENDTHKLLWNFDIQTDPRITARSKKKKKKETCKIVDFAVSAVPLVKYLGLLLKRIREKLRLMNLKTRKSMPMHQALHPRRLHTQTILVKKIEDDSPSLRIAWIYSMRKLKDFIKKKKERFITAMKNISDKIKTNRTKMTKLGKRNRKKNNYLNISNDKLMKSQRKGSGYGKGNLKRESESLLTAALNNTNVPNISKLKSTIRYRIANVGYVVIKTKRLIT